MLWLRIVSQLGGNCDRVTFAGLGGVYGRIVCFAASFAPPSLVATPRASPATSGADRSSSDGIAWHVARVGSCGVPIRLVYGMMVLVSFGCSTLVLVDVCSGLGLTPAKWSYKGWGPKCWGVRSSQTSSKELKSPLFQREGVPGICLFKLGVLNPRHSMYAMYDYIGVVLGVQSIGIDGSPMECLGICSTWNSVSWPRRVLLARKNTVDKSLCMAITCT